MSRDFEKGAKDPCDMNHLEREGGEGGGEGGRHLMLDTPVLNTHCAPVASVVPPSARRLLQPNIYEIDDSEGLASVELVRAPHSVALVLLCREHLSVGRWTVHCISGGTWEAFVESI